MVKVTQVISLVLWVIGLIILVLALIPSLGGGGGPDKLIVAAVLFLGAIAGMAVAPVWA